MTFFSAEDFENYINAVGVHNQVSAKIVADIAEGKLQREAKVVYICEDPRQLTTIHFPRPVDATHQGLLICVEEIQRKSCIHEPTWSDTVTAYENVCKHCGVKLKATWNVADE